MTARWTRGGGKQVQGKTKEEQIGRFKLFLHRGINGIHKFLHTFNAVCVHVTYAVETMHAICKDLHEVLY